MFILIRLTKYKKKKINTKRSPCKYRYYPEFLSKEEDIKLGSAY